MKGREKERERRARDLEKKAREQADQCEYLNADCDRNVIIIIIFIIIIIIFFYLSSENMSRFWLHGSLFSVVLCSGGPGGATGQSEQRAQHAETHSQQGRIQAPQHKKQPPLSHHPRPLSGEDQALHYSSLACRLCFAFQLANTHRELVERRRDSEKDSTSRLFFLLRCFIRN